MNSNTLQSNTVKTGQLCWFVNLFRLVETEFIATGGIEVPFKTSVEYLSVGLDQALSMQRHVSSIYQAAFLEFCKSMSFQSHLSGTTARLVTLQLDY